MPNIYAAVPQWVADMYIQLGGFTLATSVLENLIAHSDSPQFALPVLAEPVGHPLRCSMARWQPPLHYRRSSRCRRPTNRVRGQRPSA